jgi:hypothetical protein
MEPYISRNISDITYKSELTPAASLCEAKRRGLIRRRPYGLRLTSGIAYESP